MTQYPNPEDPYETGRLSVPPVPPAGRPMVDARDVHKAFRHNEVLKGISLQVQRGEVVVVIGPSGSGKTTFLRCINHLEKINAGRIFIDGDLIGYREQPDGHLREDTEANIARMRAEIGMVFQRFNLFPHLTALQNVMEAPVQVRRLDKAQVEAARPRPARQSGSGRESRRLSQSPLRRAAAACRHRARARYGAQADALRRGHLRSRSRAGR